MTPLDHRIDEEIFHREWTCLHYSRDIEAAWLVVNELHQRGWLFCIKRLRDEQWQASFSHGGSYREAFDKIAAEAICKAAVKVGMRARSEHCSAGS